MSNWHAADKIVKVRCRHVCEACGHSIDPGEYAVNQRGVFYGDFYHRYLHPVCNDIWFESLDGEELGDFGDALFYWLERHLGDVLAHVCMDYVTNEI